MNGTQEGIENTRGGLVGGWLVWCSSFSASRLLLRSLNMVFICIWELGQTNRNGYRFNNNNNNKKWATAVHLFIIYLTMHLSSSQQPQPSLGCLAKALRVTPPRAWTDKTHRSELICILLSCE